MKKIIIILVVLVTVITLGVFVVIRNDKEKVESVIDKTDEQIEKVMEPVDNTGFLPEDKKLDKFKDDQDRDGILDVEEEALGLSTHNFDTDGDGIGDKEEIDRWGTDPTKADTDGDGYWDFFEIMNGYNPLGEGKLSS